MGFVIRTLATAVALWIATLLVNGITLGGEGLKKFTALIIVAVIFGLVNGLIKPIIKTLGCAFYVLTLGLVALIVNALLFLLVGWIAEKIDIPFTVSNFWAALWGAIVVGIVSWLLGLVLPDPDRNRR